MLSHTARFTLPLLLLVASPAWCEQSPGVAASGDTQQCPAATGDAGPHGAGEKVLAALDGLDLTPAQRQAIQALAERYRIRGQDLAQRGADIREQLLEVAPDDPTYADATARSGEAAAALAADAVRLASELRAEVHALLTPAQRDVLRQRVREKRDRWDDWRERNRSPG